MKLKPADNHEDINFTEPEKSFNVWVVRRFKDMAIIRSGKDQKDIVDENGKYAVYGSGGIFSYAKTFLSKKVSVLLGRKGTIDKPIFVNMPFWTVDTMYYTDINKNTEPKFFFYLCTTINFEYYNYGSAVPSLSQKDLSRIVFLVPKTLGEQKQISQYIDLKTFAIDSKISLLEDKILKYKDLNRAIINEAVCKGLNKNVPLKDSGVEWIGEIPEHWQVKRLKDVGYLYSGLSGKTGEHFNQEISDNSQHYIPFTNIANNKYINHEDLHNVLMEENERQNKVKKNDLFFLMSSEGFADIGKAALLIEDVKDTYLNSFCKGFRITKKTVVPKYLNYLLNSAAFRDKFIVQGKGFTRINLKMEKVSAFEFIIPPVEEQTAIAEHLDKKTATIDAIVANIKLQIDRLKELRKTLINDVVTGKLKVIE